MAEHIRNELARAGSPVRPARVTTLAKFLEPLTPLAAAPEPVLHLLIDQALDRVRSLRFAAVAEFRGFVHALAALIEEAPASALSGAFGEDLARVFRDVEAALAARGMGLRNHRLDSCRKGPRPAMKHVVFDGFFSFSYAELDFIAALAAHTDVTITLPDCPSSSAARERMLAAGLAEQRLSGIHRQPRRKEFAAPTLERETEEIARRILEHSARGRKFREMGVILRSRDPYGSALETTLARFGIPARLYFSDPLAMHPVVSFLSGVVRVMLNGWDHASLLTLLRMPVSGSGATPAGDRFDFAMREKIPGVGLPLPELDDAPEAVASLAALDGWRRERLDPADWAARLKKLRGLAPKPVVGDLISREQLNIWRSTSAALDAFTVALDETAAALAGAGRMPLAEFWRQAEVVLALDPLRVADRRRDVVHVMDVFEARQWELPVVFICGLMERHFPQYHREDPLLNDAARRRAGLKTSADLQAEERFLFELATTRATEEVVLSYARFNEKGEETLPSFFFACGEKKAGTNAGLPAGLPAPQRSTTRLCAINLRRSTSRLHRRRSRVSSSARFNSSRPRLCDCAGGPRRRATALIFWFRAVFCTARWRSSPGCPCWAARFSTRYLKTSAAARASPRPTEPKPYVWSCCVTSKDSLKTGSSRSSGRAASKRNSVFL